MDECFLYVCMCRDILDIKVSCLGARIKYELLWDSQSLLSTG